MDFGGDWNRGIGLPVRIHEYRFQKQTTPGAAAAATVNTASATTDRNGYADSKPQPKPWGGAETTVRRVKGFWKMK